MRSVDKRWSGTRRPAHSYKRTSVPRWRNSRNHCADWRTATWRRTFSTGVESAQRTIGTILFDREFRPLPDMLSRHLEGLDPDSQVVFIVRAGAPALWLRAQRSYGVLNLRLPERPPILRCNVVCAEPMPGEKALLDQFVRDLPHAGVAGVDKDSLAHLVRSAFSTMKHAGEAGTLLLVEEEIEAEARKLTGELFRGSEAKSTTPWQTEAREALRVLAHYAESAGHGRAYLRRLFANDAAAGFAFIDVCRKRFDVVLMNPPFGEASKPSKKYVDANYPRTKHDVYAAFVERGLGMLHPRGMLGAITSRTGFFLSSFQKWREEVLLGEARLTVVADLGQGVLDTAMVETAAYCMERMGTSE